MIGKELQQKEKLEEWIADLPPETMKDLSAVLSKAVSVVEVYEHQSGIPLSAFGYPYAGISEEYALKLLGNVVDIQVFNLIGGKKMQMPAGALQWFKFARTLVEDLPKKKMEFDELNGVVRYGFHKISFQKRAGEAPRFKLFGKLWTERRYVRKGSVKKEGEAFPKEALARWVGVSTDEVVVLVKGINRQLRDSHYPAKIDTKGGVLLVVTEK